MGPDELRAWVRVFRDFTIVAVGAFMLLYETTVVSDPNAYLIGAGLAALGLPPAFRLDEKRRGSPEDGDDRWSHLP